MAFLAFSGGGVLGLAEPILILLVLSVSVAIPFVFIGWLGWWRDAGFVSTTQNAPALAVPILITFLMLPFFGTVQIDPNVTLFVLVIFLLTAVSEEALSRGLLLRVLLPHGKWQAVLIPSALFAIGHVTQLAQGMSLTENSIQIVNAFIYGVLFAAVRLRVNNIWPLIFLHMLFDVFAVFTGTYGPAAIRTPNDVPFILWR